MNNKNFMQAYCEIIDRFHGQRPDRLWFSTWMASKSPYFTFARQFEGFWSAQRQTTRLDWRQKIRLSLRLLVTLASLMGKSTWLRLAYRRELRDLRRIDRVNVVRTFLYSSNPHTKDPFWGPLIPELETAAVPVVTVFEPHFPIRECRRASHGSPYRFPYFVFLSPVRLILNCMRLLREAWTIRSTADGISELFSSTYELELLSPAALVTSAFYDCFLRLISQHEIQNFYIPFENNPWEKMLYLARREQKKLFNVIGFQHSAIQEGAANYRLSAYESENRLHPDVIFCVGVTTLRFLQEQPFYKNVNLQLGCALRQTHSSELVGDAAVSVAFHLPLRILVAMDGVPNTADILRPLLGNEDLWSNFALDVRLKEHPNVPLARYAPETFRHPDLTSARVSLWAGNLREALDWCDVVLYSGSTVSLEALEMAKPVIHISTGLFSSDPLFQLTDSSESVYTQAELTSALKKLVAIPLSERSQRAALHQAFVRSYFNPCTSRTLRHFITIFPL